MNKKYEEFLHRLTTAKTKIMYKMWDNPLTTTMIFSTFFLVIITIVAVKMHIM